MFVLLEKGEIHAPAPLGTADVLIAGDRVARVGPVDGRALCAAGLEVEVVDTSGCLVVPGFIDPHAHLLGGSGERGFSSQTPEFFLTEIARWGITSVVGVLGVDTTMKTMAGLLAKVKGLEEEGLNAYLWTGGYNVPPTSIMASVREDIMFIDEVIGAGEVAISDLRSMDPPAQELARLVTDCYVGGMLSRKAGLVHFHVGESDARLAPLRALLNEHHVEPCWLYPTHVERSEPLMREAIELTAKGMPVDVDTVGQDLEQWLAFYLDNGGDPSLLTASSDAGTNSPRILYEQVRACMRSGRFPLERVLSIVTRNPARILQLPSKGAVEAGKAADLLVLEAGTLDVVHVISRGRFLVRDGRLAAREAFLEHSTRTIRLEGREA